MRRPTRRASGRLILGLPAAVTAWALLLALPLAPATAAPAATPGTAPVATPGHLIARTITVTDGPGSAGASRSRRASAGWVTTVAVPSGTQSVSLSWSGALTGAAAVRSRSGGRWSPWTTDAAEPDESPDRGGNGRSGIGPIWFGHRGTDAVQIRVVHGRLDNLTLDAMRWQPADGATRATPAARVAQAHPARPSIHLPSEWGSGGWRADHAGCAGGPVVMSGLQFAVIHHTVNSNTYSPADVPGLMASIYRYHTVGRGWCDTAYNFIIDRFGGIWQGRGGDMAKPIMGGHALGFNTSSMGVAFLGQYEPGASPAVDHPSAAALDSARNLVAWKFGIHDIDPTATVRVQSGGSSRFPAGTVVTIPTIIGHRDVALTACPGGYLYSALPAMRRGVAAVLAESRRWSPFSSSWALVAQQYRDVLDRSVDGAGAAVWVPRLQDRTWSIGQVVATLLGSAEADHRVGSLVRLYFAFFLRQPDHGGFTYWRGQRTHGRVFSSVADVFAASTEFRHRYGQLSDAGYVDRVYRNLLGRAPDRSGSTFWSARLAGGMTRGQLMATFSQSHEYILKSSARVIVASGFEAMLRRAVDGSALAFYAARLASGAGDVPSLAATLFASAEYQRRF